MSSISNIVLNDAASPPVAHTFQPALQGLQGSLLVANYEDRVANDGIPVGFNRIFLTFERPKANRASYHVVVKVQTPVMEVLSNSTVTGITPAPQVAYLPLAEVKFVIPQRASAQSRKDLRKMVYELINTAAFKAAVEDLDPPL